MMKIFFITGLTGLLCVTTFLSAANAYAKQEKAELTTYSASPEQDTKALFETVIQDPMRSDLMNTPTLEDGAVQLVDTLDAGKELLQCPDVKSVLMKEYMSLKIPEKTKNDYSPMHSTDGTLDENITKLLSDETFVKNLEKDMDVYYRVNFLEGLFASSRIYPAFSPKDKIKLYNKSLQLKNQKEKSEVYNFVSNDDLIDTLLNDDDLFIHNIRAIGKAAEPSFTLLTENENDPAMYIAGPETSDTGWKMSDIFSIND